MIPAQGRDDYRGDNKESGRTIKRHERGVESSGMLLAGDREDGSVCVTFVDDSVPVGTRLH